MKTLDAVKDRLQRARLTLPGQAPAGTELVAAEPGPAAVTPPATAKGIALGRITPVKVPATEALPGMPQGLPLGRIAPVPAPVDPTEGGVSENAGGVILIGIVILVLFFGVLGGWAALAPLEGATMANGLIKIEGSRKVVQHADGGVVTDIRVREGDRVEAGQVLMVLDDTVPRTNVTLLSQQYDALLAQEARLTAESRRADTIEFPPELQKRAEDTTVAEAMSGQAELLRARADMLGSQTELLRKKILELEEQINGSEAQVRARAAQRRSIETELASLRPLYERGIVARTRLLELERNRERLTGEEHELAANSARARQTIEQAKQQMLQIQFERSSQIATEMRDTQNRLADTLQRLEAGREVLRHTEIKAPVEGYVLGLTVFTKGAVIAKGEKVMEIVPNRRQLMVEASIRTEDITYVRPGMVAEIRLTGLKQRTAPVLDGKVTHVSADRLTDPRSGAAYFLINVSIDEDDLARNTQLELYPGMPALVMIPTGKRTALDYLMRPLLDSLSVAFREK
ncbi:MAG: HlyD family type I secretion periplasmic adaptor subunit [Azospirillum sp.]|nr:HlyD family type I secretion periplasmic adaptor subunit [Azospirillum sp.]